MIDMGQIAAAVSSLKVAGDIAQGLMSLKTMSDVQAKAIELNQQLIAAQHQIFAANTAQTMMLERVREIEGKIAAMEDWNSERQRYKMVTAYGGVTAYAVQKSMSNGETPHYLCANCFQGRKRSILAQTALKDGFVGIVCSACKFISQTRFRGVGPAKYAEDHTE
jgi:hypothetical protein